MSEIDDDRLMKIAEYNCDTEVEAKLAREVIRLRAALLEIADADTDDIGEQFDEWGQAALLCHVQKIALAALDPEPR